MIIPLRAPLAGLVVSLLCAVPGLGTLGARLLLRPKARPAKDLPYEDDDGKSTVEDTRSFTNSRPKLLAFLSCLVGCACSIAQSLNAHRDADHQDLIMNWLPSITWISMLLQATCLVACRDHIRAYNLGILLALSALVYDLMIVLDWTLKPDLPIDSRPGPVALLVLAFVASLGLMVAATSLPRRPRVYYLDRQVDSMNERSFLRMLTFNWPWDVPALAEQKMIVEPPDLTVLHAKLRAKATSDQWKIIGSNSSLAGGLLLRILKRDLIMLTVMTFPLILIVYGPFWTTLEVLRVLENLPAQDTIGRHAWLMVFWMAFAISLESWYLRHMRRICWGDFNNTVQALVSSLLFEKLLRRKNAHDTSRVKDKNDNNNNNNNSPDGNDAAPGESKTRDNINQLFGYEMVRLCDMAGRLEMIFIVFARLFAAFVFLRAIVGWVPLLSGFAAWAVTGPLTVWTTKNLSRAQRDRLRRRDGKQRVVNECINGLRHVKLAGLEPDWERRIMDRRAEEMASIWRMGIAEVINEASWMTGPIITTTVTLVTYTLLHGELKPSLAFMSVVVFRQLERMLDSLVQFSQAAIITYLALKRLTTFLTSAETENNTTDGHEIAFANASVAWPSDDKGQGDDGAGDAAERFVLENLNVIFPTSKLSVICGMTASGKSLMISALLGEADLLSGSIIIPRTPPAEKRRDDKAHAGDWILPAAKAYVGQTPWIENNTVRQNILFGLPFDEARYQRTIANCALVKDLETLSDGDETELGVNGINLSGGQKWRVALARAVYSRAGIVILDDIFSAVDASVGRQLLEECLTGPLCAGRSVIVVTHHIDLCRSRAELIIELGDRTIKNITRSSEPQATAGELSGATTTTTPSETTSELATVVNSQEVSDSEEVTVAATDDNHDGKGVAKNTPSAKPRRLLVKKEERAQGAVRLAVYKSYFNASGGLPLWLGLLAVFLLVQAMAMGRSWWLKTWTSLSNHDSQNAMVGNEKHQISPHTVMAIQQQQQQSSSPHPFLALFPLAGLSEIDAHRDLVFYIGIYILLSILCILVGATRTLYLNLVSMKASKILFQRLTFTVLRAPLSWIDSTPAGRIVNRFVADCSLIDLHLRTDLGYTGKSLTNLLGICISTIFVSYYFLPFTAVCIWVCIYATKFYINVKRPIKRLESVGKSPIFHMFGSGVTGITTIRAYNRDPYYLASFYRLVDNQVSAGWHLLYLNWWFGMVMDQVGLIFTTAVACVLLATRTEASLAGFALSFAIEFSSSCEMTTRSFVATENYLNSLERIVEYSSIETEPLGGSEAPAAWPTEGRVEINDLTVRYAPDLPPALQGISFRTNGGERIGVCGRTGAGKSSLTLALFRFLEAESGSITIDGLDTSKMKLHDLRSRLTIIPQDPVLFAGTIRTNLDPFDTHSDEELCDALRRVHLTSGSDEPVAEPSAESRELLGEDVASMFSDLSTPVSEGGSNFSHGQRQLLCLARALVVQPRVMVLDEATSAVDMATDALIQQSVRSEFSNCTLLVIAHRLSTVADFDRILVLDQGRVAEFGTPKELWKRKDGAFRSMCEQSGERDALERVIKSA